MRLTRATITGFKSFAGKTTLDFQDGITAVVGPNGVGKSNIADALRWVLGEQSNKSIRTKKSEEVIFAGTAKRARASYAEVVLQLDNADGTMPIEFTEVELGRRLYRSGESEYSLNGRKTPLTEIQALLAAAGFGQSSYAIIGQGTIDSFILAAPAERKLLFDEASGIRAFELKREQAIRKMEATADNLQRVEDILAELAPRRKTLERALAAQAGKQALLDDLADRRANYITTATHQYQQSAAQIEQRLNGLADQLSQKRDHYTALQQSRNALEQQSQTLQRQQAALQHKLRQVEEKHDRLSDEVAVKKAELQLLQDEQLGRRQLEQELTGLAETLAALQAEQAIIEQKLLKSHQKMVDCQAKVETISRQVAEQQTKLNQLRRQSDQTSRPEYISQALAMLKQVSYALSQAEASGEQIRLLVYKAGRLLSHASKGQADIVAEIQAAHASLTGLMNAREKAREPYNRAVIAYRSLELDQDHVEQEIAATKNRQAHQQKQLSALDPALKTIEKRASKLAALTAELGATASELTDLRHALAEVAGNVTGSSEVFALAAELEAVGKALALSENEQSQQQAQLAMLREQQNDLATKKKQWFGSHQPAGKISRQPLAELEQAMLALELQIEASGDGDMLAHDELQEVSQRHNFMDEQLSDLRAAYQDLGELIKQMDQTIAATFEQAFSGIASNFARYFALLFGGGSAELAFTRDTEGNYGIDIKASPPHKRVTHLASLSGGERSLTGIALLAAIVTVNPSPFVVLDEVDAALDEANSGKLAEIFSRLAERVQLIVITHNRQTMQQAGSLFGVTMDNQHSSHVLSLKLEQAEALASR